MQSHQLNFKAQVLNMKRIVGSIQQAKLGTCLISFLIPAVLNFVNSKIPGRSCVANKEGKHKTTKGEF